METPACYGPFSFFRRHWNGDYSLGRSYWLNSVVVQWLGTFAVLALIPWLSHNFAARYAASGVLASLALIVAIWFWGVRGTWVSAGKHAARGGREGWANAARVMMIIGGLRLFAELAGMSGVIADNWKIARGWQAGPETTLQVRADGKSVLLQGGINDGTAERLTAALDKAPSARTVVLQSSGGWVRQGILLAKIIEDRRLDTYVEGECDSACTIAFLGGYSRSGEPNARLGFHAFQSMGAAKSGSTAADIAAVRETYRHAGLSEAFIAKIVATPPEKVWYPSHDELLAERVFTRVSLGGENAGLATSTESRATLVAEFRKVPAFEAMAARYPADFSAMVDKAWQQVQARRPDAEVMAAAHEQVAQLAGRLLPDASDDTLLAFNRLLAEQIGALQRRDATACVELMFPTGRRSNPAALLPQALRQRELEMLAEMIRTSDRQHASHITADEARTLVRKALAPLSPAQREYLVSEPLRSTAPYAACGAALAYLQALNNVPARDRTRTLRAVYSHAP